MYDASPRVVMPVFSRGDMAEDTRRNLARRNLPLEKYGRKAGPLFPPRVVYPRVVLYSMHDRFAPEPPTRVNYFLRAAMHARSGMYDFSPFVLLLKRGDWRRN